MKKALLVAFILIFSLLQSLIAESSTGITCPDNSRKPANASPDSVSIAICTLNLLTYQLDSVNVTRYRKEFSTDTLPLTMYFDNDWDLAHLYFYYGSNLVFKGGTSWMGYGHIEYPVEFSADTSAGAYSVPLPGDTKYFHSIILDDSFCTWAQYLQKADSAWDKVKNLEVVSALADNKYKVGIVAYSRSEGLFIPEYASWLVFIYSETYPESMNDVPSQKIRVYPNPAADIVTIDPLEGETCITDITGRKVLTVSGNPVNVSALAPGVYFIIGKTRTKLIIER